MGLCDFPTILIEASTFPIAILSNFKAKPTKLSLTKPALHMFAILEMFNHNIAMRASSVLWSHVIFSHIVVLCVLQVELSVPRAVVQVFLEK